MERGVSWKEGGEWIIEAQKIYPGAIIFFTERGERTIFKVRVRGGVRFLKLERGGNG